jgi:parvulin-like peptidyl-prolyl isomerase
MRFSLCAGILAFASVALASDVHVVEEIVAKVNSDIITRGELETIHRENAMMLKQQGLSASAIDKAIKEQDKDALRDEIDRLLLVQHAKDLNINVDSDVTKRIAAIQTESGIADPDKFHDWIREKYGIPFEELRSKIHDQIVTQRVIGSEVMSRINVPHSEVEKYYEEHKSEFVRKEQVFLREILISTEGKAPDQAAQAEKRAKDLAARARKGEKFGELAKQYSDSETKDNFGELPPYNKGQLRKDLEDIVFKEKKGYVTDAIKQPNGFLILKIEDRYEAGQAPIEAVENEIMEKLSMPRMQPKVRELLTKLREDAFLEIRAGYIDSGAAPGKNTAWQDPAQLKPETTTKEEVASHRHRKRLLWTVPIPGTDKNGNFPSAKTAGDSKSAATPASAAAAPPSSGESANRTASAADPSTAGSTPSKQ